MTCRVHVHAADFAAEQVAGDGAQARRAQRLDPGPGQRDRRDVGGARPVDARELAQVAGHERERGG